MVPRLYLSDIFVAPIGYGLGFCCEIIQDVYYRNLGRYCWINNMPVYAQLHHNEKGDSSMVVDNSTALALVGGCLVRLLLAWHWLKVRTQPKSFLKI